MTILTREQVEAISYTYIYDEDYNEVPEKDVEALKDTALALMDYIEADKGIIKQYEGRCEKLEADLALANEEIRHAYNDNETHRRRIGELEREVGRLKATMENNDEIGGKWLQTHKDYIKKLEAVVEGLTAENGRLKNELENNRRN